MTSIQSSQPGSIPPSGLKSILKSDNNQPTARYIKIERGQMGSTSDKKLASTSKEIYKFVKERHDTLSDENLQILTEVRPKCKLSKRESFVLSIAKHIPVISTIASTLIGLKKGEGEKNVKAKDVMDSYQDDKTAVKSMSALLERKLEGVVEKLKPLEELTKQIVTINKSLTEEHENLAELRKKKDKNALLKLSKANEPISKEMALVSTEIKKLLLKFFEADKALENEISKTPSLKEELLLFRTQLTKFTEPSPDDNPLTAKAKNECLAKNEELMQTLDLLPLRSTGVAENAEIKISRDTPKVKPGEPHPEDKSETLTVPTNISDRTMGGPQGIFYRENDANTAYEHVKAKFKAEGKDAPEFTLGDHTLTFEGLAALKNPTHTHLCNAISLGLANIDREETVEDKKMKRHGLSFMAGHLEDLFNSTEDLKKITSAEDLKKAWTTRLEKHNVKEETIDRETFADLTQEGADFIGGKTVPRDLYNAPEFNKALADFMDSIESPDGAPWPAEEERTFQFTQLLPPQLTSAKSAIDTIFNEAAVIATINKLLQKNRAE